MKNPRLFPVAVALLCAAAPRFSTAFAQGSLTPPSAPAPSMKTLDQIEPRIPIASLPFMINDSGSYYLTTNLTGVTAASGITVAADNVVIDLKGFSLIGVSGSLDGISFYGSRENVIIRNGIVRGWGRDGIWGNGARGVHYEDLVLTRNGRGGLIGDFGTIVSRCSAVSNALWGISVNTGSTVSDCTAYRNGDNGFSISNDGSTIRGCSSSDNSGAGFFGGGSDQFLECAAARNKSHGFTGGGNTFIKCSASNNGGNGIDGSYVVRVEDCSAHGNTNSGIAVNSTSRIENNHCYNNGNGGNGAGIHASGSVNRIQGNSVLNNDYGLQIDGIRNLVFGNSAGNNSTNYFIATNNYVGYIVVPTSSPAVAGSTGGWGMGNADSWANFSQ